MSTNCHPSRRRRCSAAPCRRSTPRRSARRSRCIRTPSVPSRRSCRPSLSRSRRATGVSSSPETVFACVSTTAPGKLPQSTGERGDAQRRLGGAAESGHVVVKRQRHGHGELRAGWTDLVHVPDGSSRRGGGRLRRDRDVGGQRACRNVDGEVAVRRARPRTSPPEGPTIFMVGMPPPGGCWLRTAAAANGRQRQRTEDRRVE